ncbi:MAG TPA: OsmC family protein [Dehalococcoidia bacterium]|nr:OsmC family protein [Dehalococcoidia bacterium]
MKTATYTADVRWTGDHRGELRCGNGPVLPFSAPPDAHGEADILTPEDAFVGAVNTCVMLMFLWTCERLRIPLVSYECAGEGTKVITLDRTETFERVVLRPRIVVKGAEAERTRVERALESARKYSLVANSITSELVIRPDIVTAP